MLSLHPCTCCKARTSVSANATWIRFSLPQQDAARTREGITEGNPHMGQESGHVVLSVKSVLVSDCTLINETSLKDCFDFIH